MDERSVRMLRERPATADLLLSLASAALSSYRRTTVARPLPQQLAMSGTAGAREGVSYDWDAALALFSALPSVKELAVEGVSIDSGSARLLDYLLHPDTLSLRKIPLSTWLREAPAAAARPSAMHPDLVVDVEHGRMRDEYPNPLARAKLAEFTRASQVHPIMVAYHGTDLCNVHNILRESLKNDAALSGRNGAIFGQGIYLSEDPVVASNFLKYGPGWKHSALAPSLACLLECEVVNDPACVLHGVDEQGHERMPNKYVLVKNDCMVRVRRVLVYCQRPAPPSDLRWMAKWILLACVLALVFLATWKNANAQRALQRYLLSK